MDYQKETTCPPRILLDSRLQVLRLNRSAYRFCGPEASALIGSTVHDWLNLESTLLQDVQARLLHGCPPWNQRLRLRMPDLPPMVVEFHCHPIRSRGARHLLVTLTGIFEERGMNGHRHMVKVA
ncbi:MAG: PAS domain-containing protein [Aquisalimonadaceae bacterium]